MTCFSGASFACFLLAILFPFSDGCDDGMIADHVDLPSPPLGINSFADSEILSADLAREAVLLAGSLIYQIENETQALELLPEEYTFHTFQDTGSTEVMIISTETTTTTNTTTNKTKQGKIIVLFRGTDGTADGDWLTNIDLPKVPYGPPNKTLSATTIVASLDFKTGKIKNSTISLKVHRGFNGVFSDGLYEHVVSVLENDALLGRRNIDNSSSYYYYQNTVHFMGHSLGGANAQLMGTYFAHFNPDIQTHITSLGAPRQGNFAFKILAESLPNLVTWRMVFCNDVVPRVPSVRYYHAGHLMFHRCEDDSVPDGDRVGAYYRQDGDPAKGFAELPWFQWALSPFAGLDLVNHHLGGQYSEWLDSATDDIDSSMGLFTNWTDAFETVTEENTRLLKAAATAAASKRSGNTPTMQQQQQLDYKEALQALEALSTQGALQRLRGSPLSD